MEYFEVQKIAKQTIEYARNVICSGMTLLEIREICEKKLLELGADSFWYWDIGAFVFSGDETTASVSGTQYKTSDRIIKDNDIITIDFNPQMFLDALGVEMNEEKYRYYYLLDELF